MLKTRLQKVISLMVILLAVGCSSTTKNIPETSTPDALVTKKLNRSEYEINGHVEGEGSATYFLKVIELTPNFLGMGHSDLANAEKKAPATPLGQVTSMLKGSSKAHQLALYQAIENKEDEDMILSPRYTVNKSGIPFLFESITVKVRAKTMKVKTDDQIK